MDNPLTPKKIQKLINLAEGRSLNIERLLLTEEEVKVLAAHAKLEKQNRSPSYNARYETSSGIIDLDQVEAFGESGSNVNTSLSKSSTFNPGEITGRSTGTSEAAAMSGLSVPDSKQYGRHSIAIDSITNKMDKQTSEINNLLRHSIASNYSFHSKRDLTADEASLIAREAPLPVMQQTHTYFADTVSANTSNLSVGAYFKNRCMDFGKILGKTESPDKSYMMPSITEVSGPRLTEQEQNCNLIQLDDMLDSVPVRQPRNNDTQLLEKSTVSSHTSKHERTHIPVFKQPAKPQEKPMVKAMSTTKTQESNLPQHIRALNPTSVPHRSFKTSSKPTDVLLKNLQSTFMPPSDDTNETMENSISLSKIADYLGKQSNVSITDILQKQKKSGAKSMPLSERNMNAQTIEELPVTKLIDTKRVESASSAGTIQTVIDFNALKIKDNIPEVVITQPTIYLEEEERPKRLARSKSPSSHTPSTQSTVRDNCSSVKSGDSPFSNDEANRSKVPSPNIAYKELDKSVDWQEVLQQKKVRQRGVVTEQWVSIMANPVEGFVGVTKTVAISVTTVADSWLTARFQFNSLPNDGKDMNVELPRLPLLLSPGKTEDFTFHITSNVEMNTVLPYSFFVKDTSIDSEIEQKGELKVNFKLPAIQAMSSDGINKILYPAIPENTALSKTFILLSDCLADLQLKLSITEGDSIFCIKSVQEIRKADVNKVLLERQGAEDASKPKGKLLNKQLCRLARDRAIRVSITFTSPKVDMKIFGQSGIMTSYNGLLQVTLIGSDTVLGSVYLIGLVGIPKLHVDELGNKIHVNNEAAEICVSNRGTVAGTWVVKCKSACDRLPFEFQPVKLTIAAEAASTIRVFYTGNPDDGMVEIPIYLEEQTTGETTELILAAGSDKPRIFPIKSSTSSLSWVREGRKEISLKNNLDKKVHVRCHIAGEGFSMDMPGGDSRVIVLSFNPLECRPLSIVFAPASCMPHAATLHMALDRTNDGLSRKIRLFGCSSGAAVRWAGLVTYSDTAALVRAAARAPLHLRLHNRATMPAFVAATVHYNLQYMQVQPFCELVGANKVVPGRAYHTITLRVDWPRVERRAREAATTALATVTVLTGAEATRRRILKILRDESKEKLDSSLLPEHLRVLTQEFDGEDPAMDNFFAEYSESKGALSELIHSGLQELTAHVDLPRDAGDDTILISDDTILVSDDTVLDHHTLRD